MTRADCSACITALLLIASGCAHDTAVAHGRNTALDGRDLVQMTDDMAMKIVASPVCTPLSRTIRATSSVTSYVPLPRVRMLNDAVWAFMRMRTAGTSRRHRTRRDSNS